MRRDNDYSLFPCHYPEPDSSLPTGAAHWAQCTVSERRSSAGQRVSQWQPTFHKLETPELTLQVWEARHKLGPSIFCTPAQKDTLQFISPAHWAAAYSELPPSSRKRRACAVCYLDLRPATLPEPLRAGPFPLPERASDVTSLGKLFGPRALGSRSVPLTGRSPHREQGLWSSSVTWPSAQRARIKFPRVPGLSPEAVKHCTGSRGERSG